MELQEQVDTLQKRVDELEAGFKLVLEKLKGDSAETPKKEILKKLVTPETTFKVAGSDTEYRFAAPNFYHAGKLYISEEIMADTKANSKLLADLVKNQMHDKDGFQDGLLVKAN